MEWHINQVIVFIVMTFEGVSLGIRWLPLYWVILDFSRKRANLREGLNGACNLHLSNIFHYDGNEAGSCSSEIHWTELYVLTFFWSSVRYCKKEKKKRKSISQNDEGTETRNVHIFFLLSLKMLIGYKIMTLWHPCIHLVCAYTVCII